MAAFYKVLGQSDPSADTPTDIYTVGSGLQTVCSSIVVCNRSATATVFRIAVRPAGDSLANEHYLYYGVDLPGNDTFIATIGVTLEATDVVTVYALDATVSFNLFGQEIN